MPDLLLFILWGFLCMTAGWIAMHKGRNYSSYSATALLLSALAGLPAFFATMNDSPALREVEARVGQHAVAPGPPSPWLFVLPASVLCLIGVALLPNKNLRRCPDCGEMIRAEARLCRFCRHDFTKVTSEPTA